MANFSDNLAAFLNKKGISIRALEQQIGCSNGVISRSINKGTDISSQWVSKIIEIYPDLNPTWLLLGKGEMLLSNATSSSIEEPGQSIETHPQADVWAYLRDKDQEIGRLNKEIGRLEARIEELERNAQVHLTPITEAEEVSSPPVLQNS